MSFINGLAGAVGGLLVFVIAGFLFGAAQFIAPTLAAAFMWLAVLGLAVTFFAPVYFWIGLPLYRRTHKA